MSDSISEHGRYFFLYRYQITCQKIKGYKWEPVDQVVRIDNRSNLRAINLILKYDQSMLTQLQICIRTSLSGLTGTLHQVQITFDLVFASLLHLRLHSYRFASCSKLYYLSIEKFL